MIFNKKKYKFDKKLHLLKSNDFFFIFKKSNRIKTKFVDLIYYLNKFKYPRIGLIIPKKQIKFSHERNKIKRITREIFRLNQKILPFIDFILIYKKEIKYLNKKNIIKIIKKIFYRFT